MAEPTLTEVFGINATQTSTTLTITKADLNSTGLTPGANNTAESLFVALLQKAQQYLTQTNFDANIDQSITITDSFSSFTTRGTNNAAYRTDSKTISLSKVDNGATIDPDDY
jgi:hypothetical protein